MAAPLLPQDVTEHLTAAIQLSNKHIHLRFLEEAETLLSLADARGRYHRRRRRARIPRCRATTSCRPKRIAANREVVTAAWIRHSGRTSGAFQAWHRRISLADCCALALARRLGARLVTADRHEFEPILSAGINRIVFIR